MRKILTLTVVFVCGVLSGSVNKSRVSSVAATRPADRVLLSRPLPERPGKRDTVSLVVVRKVQAGRAAEYGSVTDHDATWVLVMGDTSYFLLPDPTASR